MNEILKEIYSAQEASEDVKRYYMKRLRSCIRDALIYSSCCWLIGRGLETFLNFPDFTFSVSLSLASIAYALTNLPYDFEHYYNSRKIKYKRELETKLERYK